MDNMSEYRMKRNSRERNRVRKITSVFEVLKKKLPTEWTSRKMSKTEILKKTVLYIQFLSDLVQTDETKTGKNNTLDSFVAIQGPLNQPLESSVSSQLGRQYTNNDNSHQNDGVKEQEYPLQWKNAFTVNFEFFESNIK
jgi:hypothetical protein